MADVFYPGTLAADPGTVGRSPLPNAVFQVFELTDTAQVNPLPLNDSSGLSITSLASTSLGVLPPVYVTSPNLSHNWVSGTWVWRRDSFDGAQAAVTAAKNASISGASLSPAGDLSFTTLGGTVIPAGNVKGPQGSPGSNTVPTDTAIKNVVTDPASQTAGALNATLLDQVSTPGKAPKVALDAAYGPDAQWASGKVPPRIAALEMVKHWGFGTSYIKGGAGADEGTRFADRVAKRQNALSYTNWGNAGWRAEMILATVRANWVLNSRALVTVCCAYNDVNQFGNSGAVVTTREGFRGILAYLSAQVNLPITDTAFSWGPNWTAGATSTAGAYVDVAWTGDTAHLIVDYVSGTAPTLTATTPGGGATVKTVNVGGYSFPVSYGVITLSGFGSGPHTVRITATGSGTATIRGLLVQSPTPPTVAWFKEGPATSWTGGATATYNSYLKDTYLPAMAAVAATFANVVPVDVDANWNPTTMLGPDGIHPNDVGNAYIATLIEKALTPALPFKQGLNQITGANGSATAYAVAIPNYYVTGTPLAPMQVTGLSATSAAGTDAILSWTAPSNGGAAITDYTVQYRPTSGGSWTTFTHAASTATTQTVTGLTAGTSYDFQVAAVNSAGTGGFSNALTFIPYTTYAADNFNRADSSSLGTTPTGGYAWTSLAVKTYTAVTWSILSNALKGAFTSGTTEGLLYVDDAQANGRIKATMATMGDLGLAFRISDGNNFWMLWTGGAVAGTTYKLMKFVAGAYTTVVTTTKNSAPGDVLEVAFNGSTITAYVNGSQVATTTDAFNSTATKHGFRGSPASGASFTLDDFSITSS